MNDADKKEWRFEFNLPGACPADLRGRQSVRATFKLSSACIDAIGLVARHLGIKQKSLFDHLVEDMDALESIARGVGKLKPSRGHRLQKTYVLSRRSLCCLEEVSKSFNTPRDVLVEYSVQRLLPLIASERQKQEMRKAMLVEVEKHFKKGVMMLSKWNETMGGEDPFLDRLATVLQYYEKVRAEMNDIIEQGRPLEMFEVELKK